MKKLTLVVDEREFGTIRAALLLLQEQVDALPEDLAEMIAWRGKLMTVAEIERLGLRLDGQATQTRDYAALNQPQASIAVEVNKVSPALIT
jgi:hypothetical protein